MRAPPIEYTKRRNCQNRNRPDYRGNFPIPSDIRIIISNRTIRAILSRKDREQNKHRNRNTKQQTNDENDRMRLMSRNASLRVEYQKFSRLGHKCNKRSERDDE